MIHYSLIAVYPFGNTLLAHTQKKYGKWPATVTITINDNFMQIVYFR